MPARLPAPFIHLLGIIRPTLLRPDVRAASIRHIDWAGLRKAGFNAVVVDKDNCVTVPNADNLFPPYASAWETLKATFPGRVLMVSNSAGSSKDRGGIGAEALSMTLGVPVLAHRQPKPACAHDVIAYFSGRLGPPRLTRDHVSTLARAEVEEESAEEELLSKWRWGVEEGPLCGQMLKGTLEERMVAAQYRVPEPPFSPYAYSSLPKEQQKAAMDIKSRGEMQAEADSQEDDATPAPPKQLKVLVVGDRNFTDVLLARRLDLYPEVSATAVLTTDLPQPNDVRLLRKLESWLSKDELSPQAPLWAQYIRVDAPPPPPPTALERINPLFRARVAWRAYTADTPQLQLDPRSGTWKPKPIFVAAVHGLGVVANVLGIYAARVGRWGWAHTRTAAASGYAAAKAKAHEVKEKAKAAREESRAMAKEEAEKTAAGEKKDGAEERFPQPQ